MIIILSGPVAVGKSAFADALSCRFDVTKVSTRQYIIKRCETPDERGALQAAGTLLDEQTDGAWIVDAVKDVGTPRDNMILLIDSVRTASQVQHLRATFGAKLLHVHLTASDDVLRERYASRIHGTVEFDAYDKVRASATEAVVGELAAVADRVVDAGKSDTSSLVAYAVAGRNLFPPPHGRLVDVLVGGQYGSEGKGNICSFLAGAYQVLLRVGGPNAGHVVRDPPYKYQQLPSATGSNPDAKVLICAGSTIWLPQIMKEIKDHAGRPGNIWIDPQAMIIEQDDRDIESDTVVSIASTKQGVGLASARKIVNRGDKQALGKPVRLARDVSELTEYVRDTKVELERSYSTGQRILLEGTQGTDLSIHHGLYPHVTSRETSSSGCLSDAGIASSRVDRVFMVTRTYPIRVGGPSGDMGVTLTLDEIASRSGIPIDEVRRTETGSVSGTQRRIAEFDWERFRRSVAINGATDIALTFADYLGRSNRGAKKFDDLNAEARKFVDDLERVGGARVTLISTGPNKADVIDRRGP